MAAADQLLAQAQNTAAAQAASTLRPASDPPTPTDTPSPTPSDAEREAALLRRVQWREANGEPVFAYHTARPPVLDGMLDTGIEWTRPAYQADTVVFQPASWTGPADASSRFYLTWDRDNLYLGAEVWDDAHVQESSGATLYNGDDVELQLDTELAGDFSRSSLSSDDGQLGFAVVNPATGAVEAQIWRPPAREGPLSLSYGARMTDGGYVLELAIPWLALNLAPRVETPFGFCLSLADTDTPGSKDQESMVSSCPRRKWGDPTTWGTLILVDW
jgi:hypothetical protein